MSINIPVFMSFDERYAPYAATSIASICSNTTSFVHFFIIDCGVSEETKSKVNNLKKNFFNLDIDWMSFDIKKFLDGFKTDFHISLATYGRVFIPFLNSNINKAIYLDVDTIVLSDISELYETCLDGYALAAIWEDYMEVKGHNKEHLERLGIAGPHKYFNAGVLLLDLSKWREHSLTSVLLEAEFKLRDKLKFLDQDLLNYVFANNYKLLNEKFNVTAPRARKHYKSGKLVDCVIRHFEGGKKPWFCHPLKIEQMKSNHIGVKAFWKYAKMTPFYNEMISIFPVYSFFFKKRK